MKVGDEVQVLNDRAFQDMVEGREPYTLKTVKIHELIESEGKVTSIKFQSGTTRHQDGREEPYFLTYPIERVVE